MLGSLKDYKNSVINQVIDDERIDPGTFSFMEPGWWTLHAAAITGIYLLGSRLNRRS